MTSFSSYSKVRFASLFVVSYFCIFRINVWCWTQIFELWKIVSCYACTPFKKDLLFTYVLTYIFGRGSHSLRVMSFSWSIRFMSIKFLKACDVKFYINLHVTYVNRLIMSFYNMILSHVKTHSLLLDSIYIWSI